MSFKIPCGGFKLDEKSFSLDVNGVLSVSGGGSGGGVFRVNLTPTDGENQYSADKTFDEIVAAHKGGMEVEAVTVESSDESEYIAIYRLADINIDGFQNLIVFTHERVMRGSFYIYAAAMGANGVVTITEKQVS